MRASVFEDIFKNNRWNGAESRSGPGSSTKATELIARILVELVAGVGATSVLDAPCGDSAWMPELPGYLGVDISPSAVDASRKAHPERRYEVADFCADELGPADLIICRDGIQHLPLLDSVAAIENFRSTGAAWLVASTYEDGANRNVAAGGYFQPDLQAPPFSLGTPFMVIEDGFWDEGVIYPDKYLGVWALA